MLSIVYGLISAVAWGAADFAGGLASRRATSFQVVTVTWLFGLVVLPATAVISREPMMPVSGWLWCAAGGAFGVMGILLLYHLLAAGSMSIAVSISAVMAGALPVIVGAVLEGLPKPVNVAGFFLALVSIWLISTSNGRKAPVRLREIGLPLAAGAGFGMYFILVNRGSQDFILWPMVATRVMGALVLFTYFLIRRQKLKPPQNTWWLLITNFILDSLGTVAFILAGQLGRMDIAAVLGSLYPGITILLSWLVLNERLKWLQWVGIGVALAAIVFFSI